jgi:hypothetical protein
MAFGILAVISLLCTLAFAPSDANACRFTIQHFDHVRPACFRANESRSSADCGRSASTNWQDDPILTNLTVLPDVRMGYDSTGHVSTS